MSSLSEPNLVENIIRVLKGASKGKGQDSWYLSAYQILMRLDDPIRQSLIAEYGVAGGKGAGRHYSAATHVARAANRIDSVHKVYLDTRGIEFHVADPDDTDEAGYPLCALFRYVNNP